MSFKEDIDKEFDDVMNFDFDRDVYCKTCWRKVELDDSADDITKLKMAVLCVNEKIRNFRGFD